MQLILTQTVEGGDDTTADDDTTDNTNHQTVPWPGEQVLWQGGGLPGTEPELWTSSGMKLDNSYFCNM